MQAAVQSLTPQMTENKKRVRGGGGKAGIVNCLQP